MSAGWNPLGGTANTPRRWGTPLTSWMDPAPATAGHEFKPCARSAAQVRIRVAQGEALRIERGEPFLPGDVLELARADRGKVDMQGACDVGFRRRSCRYAVMRLNPTADFVVIGGDIQVLEQPGREFPSADPTAGAGDETLQIGRARATIPVRVQLDLTAFPAPPAPTDRARAAHRDGRPIRGLAGSHRERCCCLKREQPERGYTAVRSKPTAPLILSINVTAPFRQFQHAGRGFGRPGR